MRGQSDSLNASVAAALFLYEAIRQRLVEGSRELPEQELSASIVQEVTTGQRTLAELRAPPLEISREFAVSRLQGSLIGPDGQTTCALITLGGGAQSVAIVRSFRAAGDRRHGYADFSAGRGPTGDAVRPGRLLSAA